MKALVIVHLSSLDAYAKRAGLPAAAALAHRLEEAILSWPGSVYVIDQRWPIDEWSGPRWNLVKHVQLKRDIQWMEFDEDEQDWTIFLKHFRAALIRAGVKEVVLGGVWYYPDRESGAVTDAYLVLKHSLKVKIDDNLVGTWARAS